MRGHPERTQAGGSPRRRAGAPRGATCVLLLCLQASHPPDPREGKPHCQGSPLRLKARSAPLQAGVSSSLHSPVSGSPLPLCSAWVKWLAWGHVGVSGRAGTGLSHQHPLSPYSTVSAGSRGDCHLPRSRRQAGRHVRPAPGLKCPAWPPDDSCLPHWTPRPRGRVSA